MFWVPGLPIRQNGELEYEVELWRANQPTKQVTGEVASEDRDVDEEGKEQ